MTEETRGTNLQKCFTIFFSQINYLTQRGKKGNCWGLFKRLIL